MGFNNDDYIDVAARIADFKETHPDGRLRPANPDKPYTVETIDGKTFIVYAAACHRDADDVLPGIGVAWEPFPGTTNFTRNSELQNAETSAWGRAIVAALQGDTKKSVASAQEVRNRSAERDETQTHRALVSATLESPQRATRTRREQAPDDEFSTAKPFDPSDWTKRLLSTSDKVGLAALGAELARARSAGMADEDTYAECHAAGVARQVAVGVA
jgi:hypothetical protein